MCQTYRYTCLDIQDFQNITDLHEFIFKILLENKLKIFRWKLLQFIIPTKSHLFKWKISTDSLCNVYKVEEDYDHLFMSCKYLDIFWNKINEMLKKVQFENNIKLQHLVFGYKIFDKEYFHLNYFLALLAFTIYKSCYVSNKRQRQLMFICYLKVNFKEK